MQEQVVQIQDAGWKNVLLSICNSEHFATTRASLKMGQDAKSVIYLQEH